ncbi:CRISPR-associated endonuclease Cas2 [Candidatus Saccharibacteria bacterium]|nr:CRISPR-associated endonuclease Cas2 [Candidatus Saccharibacteria bacterium]
MIVVAYDIPERRRKVRRHLRKQLERWNFVRVQRSVWQTQSKLPIGFTKMIHDFDLRDSVEVYFTSDPTPEE